MNGTENDNLVAQLLSINDEKEALARENNDLKELLVKMSEEQPHGGDPQLIETVRKQAQMINDLTAQAEALQKDKQELIRQRTEQVVLERALREQISKGAQAPIQASVQATVQAPMQANATTSNHAANTIADISNLLSVLNQQMRNDSVESAEKIDQLTKERNQSIQERDVAIATMKQQVNIFDNRFSEMRQESLDALKLVRTKAESVERLLTQRTNELANVIEQRDNCIILAQKNGDELNRVKMQLNAESTMRVDAVKFQHQMADNLSDVEKKLKTAEGEVHRMHEMVRLRTDEKAKLQKQLDDLQPILSALSKHWGQ